MDERGIIIADRDAEYRKQMAEFFQKAGYAVETTDSAIHVLCSILEKQTPVLLLGNDFDKKISAADLIHLLKKCNRHLHVIMVSDQMPLAEARQVRQEGIFYHALRPAAGDAGEIDLAVQCAFGDCRKAESAQLPEAGPPAATEPDEAVASEKRNTTLLAVIFALVAVICITSYLSLVTAQRVNEGNSTALWIFLAFCALIVSTQLLPIFRIRWHSAGREENPSKQQSASPDEK